MRFSERPRMFRWVLNLWPPFAGAGVRVDRIAPDWSVVDVSLRMGPLNRNYVGTHFGGSLYAMTDPWFMFILIKRLGPRYVVWDVRGEIDYLRPGRGLVRASFSVDDHVVSDVRAAADRGERPRVPFTADIVDGAGKVVARVTKTVYVRRADERRSR